MKNIISKLVACFLFICALFLFTNDGVSAKSSINDVFEVEVGTDKLPLYYSLEDDNGTIREKVQFAVTLKGLADEKKSYRWEHTLCYKISGSSEVCEIDITGSDQEENNQDISSNNTYNYYFYDSDMPYYSEELIFEYVRFSNKFISLENDEEIILDDIVFSALEIDYDYNFRIEVNYNENNSYKYVDNYYSNISSDSKVYVRAYLYNNIGSNLLLDNAPTYTLTNQVCVGENICQEEVLDMVTTNSDEEIALNPYMGNLTFYYSMSSLVYDSDGKINNEFANYKTVLKCTNNCNSRIPTSIILLEETFYFDNEKPIVDEENTIIASVNEYVQSIDIKISVEDTKSGLDETKFIYTLTRPYSTYCTWGSTTNHTYQNGVSFTLGIDLSDGPYCMKYYAYDKNGNYYESDYYIFYFDNTGPNFSINSNGYIETNYYSNIDLKATFTDYYSGIDALYYFWSISEIDEEDYLMVKNKGKLYVNETIISSAADINIDGTYYLYFLAFDKLGNYKFYDSGRYNIDTIGLKKEEVLVTISDNDNYSNNSTVKVSVEEMIDEESFSCGFFVSQSNVNVNSLSLNCKNNINFSYPSNLEGEYSLWVYVHDRANNHSLLEVASGLLIDTSGPIITYSILKDDNQYHLTNEIKLSVSDLSGVNANTLKYGWFSSSKTNVTKNDLTNTFVDGEVIGYPRNYYGEYKLYISSIDNLGNEKFISIDKTFKIDTDVIRISLLGEESITIIKGQKYIDEGAKAFKGDVKNGGRVSEIMVEGEVDNKRAGIYYVTYSSGEGELLVSVTRKIIVKNDTPYKIVVLILFAGGSILLVFRLFIRRREN